MGCGVSAAINLKGESSMGVFDNNYSILELSKNRGSQATGCTIYDEGEFIRHKGKGLPHEVFTDDFINSHDLTGEVGIGHVRYVTNSADSLDNAHPVRVKRDDCMLDFAMNGEISDHLRWRPGLEEKGIDFDNATNDTSTFAGLVLDKYMENCDLLGALNSVYNEVFDYGGFTVVGILSDKHEDNNYLFYGRDGLRPFHEGKIGDNLVFSSENSPLFELGAEDIREIKPGTIGIYDINSRRFGTIIKDRKKPLCCFEVIYEGEPLSTTNGKTHLEYRNELGGALRKEHPLDDDIVIAGIPESGLSYAEGYSGDTRELILRDRDKYVRTFMVSNEPPERFRRAKNKFRYAKGTIKNTKIGAVDDSVVRLNVGSVVASYLREYGAKEVHLLVGCPPIVGPCYSGVDMHQGDLIVNMLGLDPMKTAKDHTELEERLKNYNHPKLGVVELDSVNYLSVDALKKVCGDKCYGCMTGEYPYKFKDMDKTPFKFEPV